MKKAVFIIFLMLMLMLTACSENKPVITEPEEIAENTKIEENDPDAQIPDDKDYEAVPVLSFDKDIEFWKPYSENYKVRMGEWIDDRYYFIFLFSKEEDHSLFLIWDVEKECAIYLDEYETDFEYYSYENNVFSRDGKFYAIISATDVMEYSFDSSKISHLPINLPSDYNERMVHGRLRLSPNGIFCEYLDDETFLLYDILSPKEKKRIDVKEITGEKTQSNMVTNWSFNGRYFYIIAHQDSIEDETGIDWRHYSNLLVFTSEGKFVRSIIEDGNAYWDTDQIWFAGSENSDKYRIYSLSDPNAEVKVLNNIPMIVGATVHPRNGIFYSTSVPDRLALLKMDSNQDAYWKIADLETKTNRIFVPSPGGKYLAGRNVDSESFFFTFIKL